MSKKLGRPVVKKRLVMTEIHPRGASVISELASNPGFGFTARDQSRLVKLAWMLKQERKVRLDAVYRNLFGKPDLSAANLWRQLKTKVNKEARGFVIASTASTKPASEKWVWVAIVDKSNQPQEQLVQPQERLVPMLCENCHEAVATLCTSCSVIHELDRLRNAQLIARGVLWSCYGTAASARPELRRAMAILGEKKENLPEEDDHE